MSSTSLRDKFEGYNDDIHSEAYQSHQFYAGKVDASIDIDKLLDICKDSEELLSEITDLKHTTEASRDSSGADDGYAYYDGEVEAHTEMANTIKDDIQAQIDYEETSIWNDKEKQRRIK